MDLYAALFLPVVFVQTPGGFMQFLTLRLKLQDRLLHFAHQLHVLTRTHTHRVMLNTQTITDGRQFAESDRSAEALVNKKQANMHVHLFTNDMKKRHKEKHDNKFGTISDLLLSNIYVYSSHRVHLISVLLPERLVFIWSKWHTE